MSLQIAAIPTCSRPITWPGYETIPHPIPFATLEKFRAEKEYPQTRSQVDNYLDFSHYIACGLCVDSCPVNNTNPHFVGPQALSQPYRYNSDSRDQGERERLESLDTMDGVWGCQYAGAFSKVCPKGVDPALTIQRMKLELMRYRLTGKANPDKQARQAPPLQALRCRPIILVAYTAG